MRKKEELNKNILFTGQERSFGIFLPNFLNSPLKDEIFKDELLNQPLSTQPWTKDGMKDKQKELEEKAISVISRIRIHSHFF